MTKEDDKTVSLVLGSGGARGLAHIGVIHWLEENGFTIKSISGCSIGALVGGVYAAGKLDEFQAWVCAITKFDIVSLLDFTWSTNGIVKGDKVIDTLVQIVGDKKIEELPIKYTAVAADIHNGKEVWISAGPLFNAIRASISLPLFLTTYKYGGVDVIDGGVLNPVPIAPTFNDTNDLTIAVNLGGKVDKNAKVIKVIENSEKNSFTQNIGQFIADLSGTTAGMDKQEWDAFDVANQAFDAMQSTIARQKLSVYPADHYVEIARNACGILEFDLASELIDLGYAKAAKSLGNIL